LRSGILDDTEQSRVEPASVYPARGRTDYRENGVSLENLFVLLGHSSVRITEWHYKPWVKTLQKKLEEEVRKAWST